MSRLMQRPTVGRSFVRGRLGPGLAAVLALFALGFLAACQGPEEGKAPHQPIKGVDTPREDSSELPDAGGAMIRRAGYES